MKKKSLTDAYLRTLEARRKEFLVTDKYRHVTPLGKFSLCMRVFPTGRKLWVTRIRTKSLRLTHTLGVFVPGRFDGMNVDQAWQALEEFASKLLAQQGGASPSVPAAPSATVQLSDDVITQVQHRSFSPATVQFSVCLPPSNHPIRIANWSIPGHPTSAARVVSPSTAPGHVPVKPVAPVQPSNPTAPVVPPLEPALSDGVHLTPGPQTRVHTLKDVVDSYVETLKNKGNAGCHDTAADYTSLFERRVTKPFPGLANKAAHLVTTEEIVDLLRHVMRQKSVRRGRVGESVRDEQSDDRSSPIRREADKLRTLLKTAYEVHRGADRDPNVLGPSGVVTLCKSNPVSEIKPVKGANKARTRTLTPEEIGLFVMRVSGIVSPAARALELCLYLGGQRLAQLLRAEVKNYKAADKTLTLFDSKGRREVPRVHVVPVEGRAAELLDACVKDAQARGTTQLFSSHGKKPLDVNTVSKLLRAIKAELYVQGLIVEDFDVRDLRRSVETRLAALKIPSDHRANLLSHGLSGVQNRHYDFHDYSDHKLNATLTLHDYVAQCVEECVIRYLDIVQVGPPAKVVGTLEEHVARLREAGLPRVP